MTEREAKGLAAELDAHKWWRVVGIFPAGDEGWCVKCEHRTQDRVLVVYDTPDDLAEFADDLMIEGAGSRDPATFTWSSRARIWPQGRVIP